MTDERINEIMVYLRNNYTVGVQSQRIIENALRMVGRLKFARENAQRIMEAVLEPLGVSYSEIFSIAEGEVPAMKNILVPVYARYNLGVKAWVEVPKGASKEEIRQAAEHQILVEGNYDADESFDQEPSDITIYEIDMDGAQEVDKE